MTAALPDSSLQALFEEVIERVLNDELRLPSLPDIALKVRSAVADDNTTCESLTEIIAKDPGLTAYLVQAASSPVYRRAVPPQTLSEVVGLLGFEATSSLVMLHSTRNMVELNTAVARSLFNYTWERLVVKTAVASFLAQQFKYRPVDQVQLAMLLTEVGSLSVLSTMLEASDQPDSDVYFQMCRKYSKRVGVAALMKWGIDSTITDLVFDCGQWDRTWNEELDLLDIANLALYHTVQLTTDKPTLPDLDSLVAMQKIPEELRTCSEPNRLDIIADNDEEIQNIIKSFK